MRVLVVSQGRHPESRIEPRFGKARFFFVANTVAGWSAVHPNTHDPDSGEFSGIRTAMNAAELGVDAVIVDHIGPHALETLQARRIVVYVGATGTVREAVEQFKASQLACAIRPNVAAHWT